MTDGGGTPPAINSHHFNNTSRASMLAHQSRRWANTETTTSDQDRDSAAYAPPSQPDRNNHHRPQICTSHNEPSPPASTPSPVLLFYNLLSRRYSSQDRPDPTPGTSDTPSQTSGDRSKCARQAAVIILAGCGRLSLPGAMATRDSGLGGGDAYDSTSGGGSPPTMPAPAPRGSRVEDTAGKVGLEDQGVGEGRKPRLVWLLKAVRRRTRDGRGRCEEGGETQRGHVKGIVLENMRESTVMVMDAPSWFADIDGTGNRDKGKGVDQAPRSSLSNHRMPGDSREAAAQPGPEGSSTAAWMMGTNEEGSNSGTNAVGLPPSGTENRGELEEASSESSIDKSQTRFGHSLRRFRKRSDASDGPTKTCHRQPDIKVIAKIFGKLRKSGKKRASEDGHDRANRESRAVRSQDTGRGVLVGA
ncbi:hypothetical protein B0T25DRAFT_564375 [Lasiosphaeria hispida]|uniref:Uncharacterized protein n=1 Tax=Lasiosphaeria hispida TaxID=260671 RepID=A0AAJ0MHQ0_9PEZI|nr:hypothetical protein B0T25DRAFT_564375 [Lasiosphaeria hispida]